MSWDPALLRLEVAVEFQRLAASDLPSDFDVAAYVDHLQGYTRSSVRTIRVGAEELTLAEAAKRAGITVWGMVHRLDRQKLSPEDAIKRDDRRRRMVPPPKNYRRVYGRRGAV